VGSSRSGRPRVAVRGACVSRLRAPAARSSRAPVPDGRHAQPGDSRPSPGPCAERHRGGPRRKRPAAGLGQASCGRWRGRSGRTGVCRPRGAWSSCLRVTWRSRTPRPLPRRTGTKRRPWPTTGGRCTPGGWPASPQPRPPAPRMRAAPRAVSHAPRWHRGREPPHAPRPARTASEDGPSPDRVRVSPGGGGRGAASSRGRPWLDGPRHDGAP